MKLAKTVLGIAVLSGALVLAWLWSGYWINQEDMIFNGKLVAPDHPYEFSMAYEDAWLDRPDGARLHAVRLNTGGTKGKVIYLHGNGTNAGIAAPKAGLFADLGYEVLVVDYRGFGKSRGPMSQEAMLADMLALYDAEMTGDPPIILGHSLGTIFATYVAANRSVAHLVLFAPPSSLRHIMRTYYPYAPSFLLRYPLRTDQFILEVTAPIDIFHGTADSVVSIDEGLILKELLKTGDRFHPIDGAGHVDILGRPDVLEILSERLASP
jgi:pimeloyl-ACP methyl ester carboxylesterase